MTQLFLIKKTFHNNRQNHSRNKQRTNRLQINSLNRSSGSLRTEAFPRCREELKCILRTINSEKKPTFLIFGLMLFPLESLSFAHPNWLENKSLLYLFRNNKYHSSGGNTRRRQRDEKPRLDHVVR